MQSIQTFYKRSYKLLLRNNFTSLQHLKEISKDISNIKSIKYFERYAKNEPFIIIIEFMINGCGLFKIEDCLLALKEFFMDAETKEVIVMIERLQTMKQVK